MEIYRELSRAIRICFFDRKAIRETSKDKGTTYISLAIILVGLAIGMYIMLQTGEITVPLDVYIITVVMILVLSFWLIHFLAGKMKSKRDFLEFFRPAGYSNLLSILFILKPYLGIAVDALIFLWSITLSIVIVKEVYGFTYRKTFIVVGLFLLIGSLLMLALAVIAGLFLYARR